VIPKAARPSKLRPSCHQKEQSAVGQASVPAQPTRWNALAGMEARPTMKEISFGTQPDIKDRSSPAGDFFEKLVQVF
jgi:hypothetical protein